LIKQFIDCYKCSWSHQSFTGISPAECSNQGNADVNRVSMNAEATELNHYAPKRLSMLSNDKTGKLITERFKMPNQRPNKTFHSYRVSRRSIDSTPCTTGAFFAFFKAYRYRILRQPMNQLKRNNKKIFWPVMTSATIQLIRIRLGPSKTHATSLIKQSC